MYTQCPDCQTRFRVTAGALRAAHGTVRCGRCGSAFDALTSLSDTLPRPEPELAPLPLLLATDDELAPLDEPYAKRVAGPIEARFDELVDERPADATTEPSAESTIVLVDEGGVGEDITLEGERVQIEGTAAPGEEVADAEYDLDATDEFEVLHIPSSAYPDEREAERELEALILRLQREFGPATPEAQAAAVDAHDETTAGHRALSELESLVPASSGTTPEQPTTPTVAAGPIPVTGPGRTRGGTRRGAAAVGATLATRAGRVRAGGRPGAFAVEDFRMDGRQPAARAGAGRPAGPSLSAGPRARCTPRSAAACGL
jgi:predicted Zn finger-like uncharacterized protein